MGSQSTLHLRPPRKQPNPSRVPTDILLVDTNGREFTSSRSKADHLALYFSAKCSLGDNDFSEHNLPDPLQLPATDPPFCGVHFHVHTVRRHLSRLDASKATGPDGIPARVLKECASVLAPPLTSVYPLLPDRHSAANLEDCQHCSNLQEGMSFCCEELSPCVAALNMLQGHGEHHQPPADELP